MVDEAHWAGLPDGRRESVASPVTDLAAPDHEDVTFLASRSSHVAVIVHRRDLSFYDAVGVA